MSSHALAVALGVALVVAGARADAQSGGAYDLRHNTIDGGGVTDSFGGAFTLSGTIGQPDAGRLSSTAYALAGGFWGAVGAPAPTPTSTPSVTATATASATSSPSPSPSPSPTETRAPMATPSGTPTPSPNQPSTRSPTHTIAPSDTPTPTPSPSPTESPRATLAAGCVGDCNLDREVTIAELLRMVNIALGDASVDTCGAGDPNHDEAVTINEILQAVSKALAGCGG